MIHLAFLHLAHLATIGPAWLYHPLGACAGAGSKAQVAACKSYNLWSGIEPDVPQLVAAISAVSVAIGWFRRHNCHHHHCWRLQWHVHPDHGHPVCKVHHPDDSPGRPASA